MIRPSTVAGNLTTIDIATTAQLEAQVRFQEAIGRFDWETAERHRLDAVALYEARLDALCACYRNVQELSNGHR